MFARMWLVCATVVLAGVGGEREDGVAAATVLLVAFTISLVATLIARALSRTAPRPGNPTPA
jgi:hypothetical protein